MQGREPFGARALIRHEWVGSRFASRRAASGCPRHGEHRQDMARARGSNAARGRHRHDEMRPRVREIPRHGEIVNLLLRSMRRPAGNARKTSANCSRDIGS
jgi:hypothetical protein